MANTGIVLLDSDTGRQIVKKHCRREKISIVVLEDLVDAEMEQVGKLRKRGLYERFDEIFTEESD
jgi:hypothetical protein